MEKYILEVKAYNELNDREEREIFMEEVEKNSSHALKERKNRKKITNLKF